MFVISVQSIAPPDVCAEKQAVSLRAGSARPCPAMSNDISSGRYRAAPRGLLPHFTKNQQGALLFPLSPSRGGYESSAVFSATFFWMAENGVADGEFGRVDRVALAVPQVGELLPHRLHQFDVRFPVQLGAPGRALERFFLLARRTI